MLIMEISLNSYHQKTGLDKRFKKKILRCNCSDFQDTAQDLKGLSDLQNSKYELGPTNSNFFAA